MIALVVALALAAPPSPAGAARHSALPRVSFHTALGDFVVEVEVARAPASARNFLRYVDAGRYGGGAFHRTVTTAPDNQPGKAVKIDVVQAGPAPGEDFPPVKLERTRDTGLSHGDGAVSLARDGPGFGVLGRVVSGMDLIRRIHSAPARGQSLDPPVKILEAVRLPP